MSQKVKRISRYEILGELGRGAMGVVYKAKDPNIERVIALKTMRLDVHGPDQEEILRRFRHEAKLAGLMAHPNIVTVYDAGEFESVFYMALEFIEGKTLQVALHEERVLPAERVIAISAHVCKGLDYAHQRGVIHRDIKPANIILGNDGVVKIMDFGIAKSDVAMTNAGQVLGTPTFMSPEQVRGKQLDGRSDLFSYGVCLYEMVTGEKPFSGQNVTTIIYKIINEEPIPPRELDPAIPAGLSAIVLKCLAKDPAERFQSGAELVNALDNHTSFDTVVPTFVSAAAAAPATAAPVTAVAQTTPGNSAAAAPVKSVAKPAPKPASPPAPVRPTLASTVSLPRKVISAATRSKRSPWFLAVPIGIVILVLASVVIFRRFANRAIDENVPAASTSVPASAPLANSGAGPAKGSTSGKRNLTRPKPATTAPLASDPAAPAPAGDLRVTSSPAGVRVYISNITQPDWITPFTARTLDPGVYEVRFSKTGFLPKTLDATVENGKTATLSADLQEAGARLVINSTPTGAQILLNGESTGKITPATLHVDKGQHKIEVRKYGFVEESVNANVRDGEVYNFTPALETIAVAGQPRKSGFLNRMFGKERIPEGKGLLILKTKPQGATVFLNGKQNAVPTPLRSPVDPGRYRVMLRMEGYKVVFRELAVEKAMVTEITVDLEQAPAKK